MAHIIPAAPHRAYTIHEPAHNNRIYTITRKVGRFGLHNAKPVAVAFDSDIEAIRVARLMESDRRKLIIRNWQAPVFHQYCHDMDLDFIYISLKTASEHELNARLDQLS